MEDIVDIRNGFDNWLVVAVKEVKAELASLRYGKKSTWEIGTAWRSPWCFLVEYCLLFVLAAAPK
jgi:hypothetical protein